MSRSSLAPNNPLIGGQLANFRIDGEIKRGSTTQVYYGWDTLVHRPVAVKVIDARLRGNMTYAERFVREARVVQAWRHENIVQIYHADTEGGLYYLAMEYIDGLDLGELAAKYAEKAELMPQDDVLRIGRAVATALDFAHQHGTIHRDVKPSNILVSVDGRILLTDFGLAMMEEEGDERGNPRYMAPEQMMQGTAVPQSDIYSLTVILYELLTGKPPFEAASSTAIALQHMSQDPLLPRLANPLLSEETEKVVLKGLSRSPEARYRTGAELIAELERAISVGQPVPGGWITLPPLPAGVENHSAVLDNSRLSDVSIVEKIASQLAQAEGEGRFTSKNRPIVPKRAPRRVWPGRIVALILLSILVGIAWFSFEQARHMNNPFVAADIPTPTPTLTVSPSATPSPTNTPTSTATHTAVPTHTPTHTPSTTNTPTTTPTITLTPSPTLSPTPIFAGPPIRFLYDRYSFYLWNQSEVSIGVGSFTFEALTSDGEPADYSFQGRAWADIYANVETQKCVKIEINAASTIIDPVECTAYNASVIVPGNDPSTFWVPREGITMFRVYWTGVEVGRCPIVTGICDVRLP